MRGLINSCSWTIIALAYAQIPDQLDEETGWPNWVIQTKILQYNHEPSFLNILVAHPEDPNLQENQIITLDIHLQYIASTPGDIPIYQWYGYHLQSSGQIYHLR